jgi:tRNA pseudouridine55 synthase
MATTVITDLPVIGSDRIDDVWSIDLANPGALLLLDKPSGWTSFDVVAKVRNILRVKKIGHCGTLDPMATGLLLLCTGRGTRMADHYQAERKEYFGSLRLGATTATDDAESQEEEIFPVDHITPESLAQAVATFLGESTQIPPMYSARKVDGQRLYKLARRGEVVERPARPITIYEFEILATTSPPNVDVRVVCSKGTYIRTLARDLGTRLGSGGYLTALRRTASGDFHVDRAMTIDDLLQSRQRLEGSEKG